MKVRIYRNLANGLLSIQDYKTSRILGHCSSAYLVDTTFVVRPGGRRLVLKERQKNVHAFAIGTLEWIEGFSCYQDRRLANVKEGGSVDLNKGARVRYDPYQMETFCREDGSPVLSASRCYLSAQDGMFIFGKSSP